jgi:sulfate adenylyltransferase
MTEAGTTANNLSSAATETNLSASSGRLIAPYGGRLIDLRLPAEAAAEQKADASRLPSLRLSEQEVCDLELLAVGAFSPLDRFMSHADYRRVLDEMRLASGALFPIPVTLSVGSDFAPRLDQEIALRNAKNELLAVMTIEEIYEYEPDEIEQKVFGTHDARHPQVARLRRAGRFNLSGRLRVLQLPPHYDFRHLRLTPAQTRARLQRCGHRNVVAFQTRNPLHRAHEEMTKRAIEEQDARLLLHPAVGLTRPGDVDHYSRVRTYQAMAAAYYDPQRVVLALLPLAMRLAGPREALWHALIRRNYGANHLIIGRDHASPGLDSAGQPFYAPYAAQELVARFSAELGVGVVPFSELIYLPEEERYEEITKVGAQTPTQSLSGTQAREAYLDQGRPLPGWFTRPEVAEVLAEAYPPRHRQGFCVWFTGLSGAGKSTTAEILTVLLLEHGRQVTLLDGDVLRTHLSQGLGFSRADRDTNIRRIGFVAAEIARHGGVAVCAAVSPYRAARNEVRAMVGVERFIEVFVDTPLEVCEQRDAKGMYAQARRGEITGFTGIDDPYEAPLAAEITLDTVARSAEENARLILDAVRRRGFVRARPASADATTDDDVTAKSTGKT